MGGNNRGLDIACGPVDVAIDSEGELNVGIADAAAPWMIGRLRDATGSYAEGCLVLVGMALLGGLAVLGLPAGRRAT